MALHLHHGNDEAAAQAYWSQVLELPDATFHKTYIKHRVAGQRTNKLLTGICRVTVRRRADHLERTMAWIESLSSTLT